MYKEQFDSNNASKKTKIILQNRYKIGKEIGSGTFGKVFEAIDLKTGQKLAIKQAFQDKKYKNRQLDVLSGLKHENIVYMKDYYFTQINQDKYLYIVMDLFQSNLQSMFKSYRKDKRKFNSIQIKIMAFQLFKALYYLQKQKVCHRDLKPPNILINPHTLQLRICDFGSAKIFSTVQKNVTYICSRYYRSPQLLFQYTMYRTQIDVWSAGCILVQFLTKQPIFPGDSAVEQLIQIIKILGVPTQQYMHKYGFQYREQIKFPQIPHTKWQRVLKKYHPESQLTDLISKILIYDIEKRLTPFQILTHPYFQNIASIQFKHLTDKLPNLFNFDSMLSKTNKSEIDTLTQKYCKINHLKQLLSIQKDFCKLQTGDSTPYINGEANGNQQDETNGKSLVGTKQTISSKKSITN